MSSDQMRITYMSDGGSMETSFSKGMFTRGGYSRAVLFLALRFVECVFSMGKELC